MKIPILIFLCSFWFIELPSVRKGKCHLTGKVVGRDSKTLLLKKLTDDPQAADIEIQIDSNGLFSYDLHATSVEAYELIFKDEHEKGGWRSTLFFPDNDTLRFTLYPTQMADSNKITGGELSIKRSLFLRTVTDQYYNQFIYWQQKRDSAQKVNNADAVSQKIDSLTQSLFRFQLSYAVNEMNEYGYAEFIEILKAEQERRYFSTDTLIRYQKLFQQNHPDHPYNQISALRISALTNMRAGGRYFDFKAPGTTGDSIYLSNYISKNTLTLLDLWAPWCGPCIVKSQKLIPVFEEFKNSGFGVIGVVGSINSQEQFIKAVNRYNYPWNLVSEIRDENSIWEKYGIAHRGGSQFLINSKGIIVAINPAPEELRQFIKKAD